MSDPQQARNWRLETDSDGIAWLTLDKQGSSTNVLSTDTVAELERHLQALAESPPSALIVCSAKKGFIAGADVNEIRALQTPEQIHEAARRGQAIMSRLADLPFPTVAAINGFALGGGLELALACDYRVLSDDPSAVLGFPEVQLGLQPGFGGTARSIRTVGVPAAMQLMLTGRPSKPADALATGLVDRLAPLNRLNEVARQLATETPRRQRSFLKGRLLSLAPARWILARMLRKQVAARVRHEHYPAPFAIIDLWARHGLSRDLDTHEARSFAKLAFTDTARNLLRVFMLRERLKSLGAGDPEVRHVHVVGAGVMGGDIAAWCALRGFTVTLQDREEKFVRPAIERAGKLFAKSLQDEDDVREAAQRLKADVAGDGVEDADVVIEAIFENAEAKQELYRRLEPRMKRDAILATNTSSIRLEILADALRHPEKLVGLHFFNPVAKMPLVEVIRGTATDTAILERGQRFTRRIDRLPLPCTSSPGFVVNRVLMPYLMEAIIAAGEGVPYRIIDRAAEQFGMPMGPMELADTVGLDVALQVARILGAAFGVPVPPELEKMVESGQLGRKSNRGFYEYRDGRPIKPPSDAPMPDDLIDRLVLPILNESAACLREGIVESAELLDAGVIFGTGFAPFRGGPLHYARARGIDAVVSRLQALTMRYGPRFEPDSGWQRLRGD